MRSPRPRQGAGSSRLWLPPRPPSLIQLLQLQLLLALLLPRRSLLHALPAAASSGSNTRRLAPSTAWVSAGDGAATATTTISTTTAAAATSALRAAQGRGLHASGSAAAPLGARVVVVNDIAGHFEVLAGVLTTLVRDLRLTTPPRVVYTGNVKGPTINGLLDWLGPEVAGGASWHPLVGGGGWGAGGAAGANQSWEAPADALVCVSAELAPKVCSQVLSVVRPRLLLVVVHRADTHSRKARILALAPRGALRLMALAPHVANLSSHMLREHVDWAMPVAPFAPPKPCAARSCLSGFSLQGALRRFKSKHGNGYTRDYAALWARLLQLRAEGRPVPPVVVVGKGQRRDLALPRELEQLVTFHPWLRYPDFWQAIHSSLALVPAFGMPVYYESRISSTILASLIACVPVIAEQRLLDTYTFLDERHVFLRLPGEDEAAAMSRVMALPESEVLAPRVALCALQRRMASRAEGLLGGYLREAVAGVRPGVGIEA